MQPSIPDDRIHNEKQFVYWNDELTDSEAQEAFQIIASVQMKYERKVATIENLEALRDEILTRLAERDILAELDPTPVFYGEPPTVEIKGKLSTSELHKYGFDHEKKGWEIKKAHERGEEYLGQKETTKSKKAKKNGDSAGES